MNVRDPTSHLAEVLVRAEGAHREPSDSRTPAKHMTIALSREVGARGTSVAREVGQRLNWPFYDDELLQRLADDLKVGIRELSHLDERSLNWLEESVGSWGTRAPVGEMTYFRHLLRMLWALGSKGECIIVGRGAAQLLPPETTLRVRLLARLEDRIAVMSRELGMTKEQAAQFVAKTDRERAQFIKRHFEKDPTDPANYDLVLNTSRFGVEHCADLILEALQRLQGSVAGRSPLLPGIQARR